MFKNALHRSMAICSKPAAKAYSLSDHGAGEGLPLRSVPTAW